MFALSVLRLSLLISLVYKVDILLLQYTKRKEILRLKLTFCLLTIYLSYLVSNIRAKAQIICKQSCRDKKKKRNKMW